MFAGNQYTVIPAQSRLIFLQIIIIMMPSINIYYVPGAILRACMYVNEMRFKVLKF